MQPDDALLRQLAAAENRAKRAEAAAECAYNRGSAEGAVAFLELLADLERALRSSASITGRGAKQKVVQGVELVHRKFRGRFHDLGLELTPTVGHRFDPLTMEAVGLAPATEETPEGFVVAELSPGCSQQGKVLVAARVVVAK